MTAVTPLSTTNTNTGQANIQTVLLTLDANQDGEITVAEINAKRAELGNTRASQILEQIATNITHFGGGRNYLTSSSQILVDARNGTAISWTYIRNYLMPRGVTLAASPPALTGGQNPGGQPQGGQVQDGMAPGQVNPPPVAPAGPAGPSINAILTTVAQSGPITATSIQTHIDALTAQLDALPTRGNFDQHQQRLNLSRQIDMLNMFKNNISTFRTFLANSRRPPWSPARPTEGIDLADVRLLITAANGHINMNFFRGFGVGLNETNVFEEVNNLINGPNADGEATREEILAAAQTAQNNGDLEKAHLLRLFANHFNTFASPEQTFLASGDLTRILAGNNVINKEFFERHGITVPPLASQPAAPLRDPRELPQHLQHLEGTNITELLDDLLDNNNGQITVDIALEEITRQQAIASDTSKSEEERERARLAVSALRYISNSSNIQAMHTFIFQTTGRHMQEGVILDREAFDFLLQESDGRIDRLFLSGQPIQNLGNPNPGQQFLRAPGWHQNAQGQWIPGRLHGADPITQLTDAHYGCSYGYEGSLLLPLTQATSYNWAIPRTTPLTALPTRFVQSGNLISTGGGAYNVGGSVSRLSNSRFILQNGKWVLANRATLLSRAVHYANPVTWAKGGLVRTGSLIGRVGGRLWQGLRITGIPQLTGWVGRATGLTTRLAATGTRLAAWGSRFGAGARFVGGRILAPLGAAYGCIETGYQLIDGIARGDGAQIRRGVINGSCMAVFGVLGAAGGPLGVMAGMALGHAVGTGINWVVDNWDSIGEAASNFGRSCIDYGRRVFGGFTEGDNVGERLVNGVSQAASTIGSSISGAANRVMNSVGNLFSSLGSVFG